MPSEDVLWQLTECNHSLAIFPNLNLISIFILQLYPRDDDDYDDDDDDDVAVVMTVLVMTLTTTKLMIYGSCYQCFLVVLQWHHFRFNSIELFDPTTTTIATTTIIAAASTTPSGRQRAELISQILHCCLFHFFQFAFLTKPQCKIIHVFLEWTFNFAHNASSPSICIQYYSHLRGFQIIIIIVIIVIIVVIVIIIIIIIIFKSWLQPTCLFIPPEDG